MTATQEIIKDGEDGGYSGEQCADVWWKTTWLEKTLLDPNFWKAVGVTRGWEGKIYLTEMFEAKQHQFLTHLQLGKTIEDSLEAIK